MNAMSEFASARVPASSANLGPGFDVLAVALAKYVEVEARPSSQPSVVAVGEGADEEFGTDHLSLKVARHVLGHSRVALTVRSEIPLARGLGSSAALALATAAACGAEDPLSVAVAFDGHAENAAASFAGGLVAAAVLADGIVQRSFQVDDRLVALLAIPKTKLSTDLARGVLGAVLNREDAIFNLSRALLLAGSFSDIDLLLPELFHDRLHQDQRGSIFPMAALLIGEMEEVGALGACWSGAGSSVIGFFERGASDRAKIDLAGRLQGTQFMGSIEVCDFDRVGLVMR